MILFPRKKPELNITFKFQDKKKPFHAFLFPVFVDAERNVRIGLAILVDLTAHRALENPISSVWVWAHMCCHMLVHCHTARWFAGHAYLSYSCRHPCLPMHWFGHSK